MDNGHYMQKMTTNIDNNSFGSCFNLHCNYGAVFRLVGRGLQDAHELPFGDACGKRLTGDGYRRRGRFSILFLRPSKRGAWVITFVVDSRSSELFTPSPNSRSSLNNFRFAFQDPPNSGEFTSSKSSTTSVFLVGL